eukprot:7291885-Alexandrium_andersonii.AAC.1
MLPAAIGACCLPALSRERGSGGDGSGGRFLACRARGGCGCGCGWRFRVAGRQRALRPALRRALCRPGRRCRGTWRRG